MESIILGFQRGAFLKYPIPSHPQTRPFVVSACSIWSNLGYQWVRVPPLETSWNLHFWCLWSSFVLVFDQCCMIYASTSVRSPITSKRVCEKHGPLFFFHGNFIDFFGVHRATKPQNCFVRFRKFSLGTSYVAQRRSTFFFQFETQHSNGYVFFVPLP